MIKMEGVREYCEEFGVELNDVNGRPVIMAYNEGGYNSTQVDLLDLIEWLKEHKEELGIDI